jgi:ABC-type sugar transport system substrate-binding protein
MGFEKKEQGSALSALPDLLASAPAAAVPVIMQNSHSSVEAPVSIQVTAAGSDPEAVGRSIYDVAKQYLLRTLKGVT